MNTPLVADPGFAHFVSQSDAVGKTLLAILIVMSVASWAIMAVKGLSLVLRNGRSREFLKLFSRRRCEIENRVIERVTLLMH